MLSPTLPSSRRHQHSFKSFALLIGALLVCSVLAHAQGGAQKTQQKTGQDRGIRRDLEMQDSTRALGLVQSLPGRAKRYALVIGIDQYTDPQVVGLNGAANDARMLADALVRYAGFPADQVVLLASGQTGDGQPTRGNILRKLSNLAAVVPKDGLLLFSFAGHGV